MCLCVSVFLYLGIFCFTGFPGFSEWPGGQGGGGAGLVGMIRPGGLVGILQHQHTVSSSRGIVIVVVVIVVPYTYLLVFVVETKAGSPSIGPSAPEGAGLTPVFSSSLDDSESASSASQQANTVT